MEKGKRLAMAGAISATLALAGIVGASSASALPPKTQAAAGPVANAAPAPAPAVPTFVNGMAQAVFASGTANYVNHELWVELDTDTDFDGVKDRVHVDVSRPRETDTRRAEGPGHLRGQPVLRRRRGRHQLGRRPRARHVAALAPPRA